MSSRKNGFILDGTVRFCVFEDGHVNLHAVGDNSTPNNVAAVRWANGRRFLCVRRDGNNMDLQISKEEMRRIGIACILLAGEWKPDDGGVDVQED